MILYVGSCYCSGLFCSFGLYLKSVWYVFPVRHYEGFARTQKEYERMNNSSGHYVCQISDDDVESPFVSTNWRMEEDENVLPEMDDQEIRMDLTDDLLHMVFIALFFIFS